MRHECARLCARLRARVCRGDRQGRQTAPDEAYGFMILRARTQTHLMRCARDATALRPACTSTPAHARARAQMILVMLMMLHIHMML